MKVAASFFRSCPLHPSRNKRPHETQRVIRNGLRVMAGVAAALVLLVGSRKRRPGDSTRAVAAYRLERKAGPGRRTLNGVCVIPDF